MNSIINKTTVREIRHTLGRFTAILAIIALGVGFFSGVRVTTPAMVSMMNDFLQEKQFYDYRIVSTVGWNKENIDAFSSQTGVRYAEGSISLDVIYADDSGDEFVLKTHLLPENINGIQLKEGRLPEAGNECVAESGLFSVGDVLHVSVENKKDTVDDLAYTDYTVVGLADSSYYINFERGTTSIGNGSVAGFAYLPEKAFDMDYYTEAFIRFDQNYEIYSEEYDEFIDSRTEEWKKVAKLQADIRYDELISEAQTELKKGRDELEEKREEGQRELDDAKKELTEANDKLTDAKKELDSAKKELNSSKKELDAAKSKLNSGRTELYSAKEQLDYSKSILDATADQIADGESQIAEGQIQLDAAVNELNINEAELSSNEAELAEQENIFYSQYGEALAVIDTLPPEQQKLLRYGLDKLQEGKNQLEQARLELEAGKQTLSAKQLEIDTKRQELEAGKVEYEVGLQQYYQGLNEYQQALMEFETAENSYNSALEKYENGESDYNNGIDEYEEGQKEYNKGLDEYEDGKQEFESKISEAEQDIKNAEKEIEDIKKPEVYVLDRNTNISYACFENDSEIVEQVAKVFPLFFILVAALVCMTTMTRMVEEQRPQIGMFKALGYSEMTIMGKYLFYSGSAALTGCIIGFSVGTVLFPSIIWVSYKLMYIPLDMTYLFDWKLAFAAIAVSMLCSVGTTWLSCRYELSETAARLMRPKAPKAGKRVLLERIPFIWSRLKFLHKVSVRNIFRYKGRFFMMIIGIGGCMALLLTGFGLKDSVAGFAEIQYEQVQTADASVTFNPENVKAVDKLLTEKSNGYIMMKSGSWDLVYGSKVKSISLETMGNFDNMSEFMNFRTVEGKTLEYPKLNEALVSHSIAERYGAKVGKELTLRDENMRELHLKVTGIFENHVYNYIFISADTYENQLSESAEMNGAYINFADSADINAVAAEVSGDTNITSITLFKDIKTRMNNMLGSLNYIVLLVIICAAGLAFIVIYNLTNINITERTREIATIKVLGFFRRETSSYVLRENIALTAIGIIFGIVLGILLHRFVMEQIVVDLIDFRTRILPLSYLLSVVLTFAFNFIVNVFMEIKLERINMTESLKSVD